MLIFSFTYAIGLKALVIPQNALVLSLSNTGIGGNLAAEINPASLSKIDPYLGFSKNNWYGGLRGQKISSLFSNSKRTYFSFESLSVKDIELRDEIANDTPIGFFGAYWYSLDYSQAINISSLDSFSLGYRLRLHLSKMYDESMYGITTDIGITKKINDNLSLGMVIKNFGKEYKGDLNAEMPIYLGVGLSYYISKIRLNVLSDIVYQDSMLLNKYALKTNFPFINLIIGSTRGKNYNDFSMGIIIEIDKWSIMYGTLKHNNELLGSPSSFELRKLF